MSDEIWEQKRQRVRNVWDFSAETGTAVLAPCSGWLFHYMGVNAYDAYHDYKLLEKTALRQHACSAGAHWIPYLFRIDESPFQGVNLVHSGTGPSVFKN